ncbi:MAG TPA: hypothetical protein VIE17_06410, partial [Methylophilaceae bacterium]
MSQAHVVPEHPAESELPKRIRRFMLRVLPILALLHFYIGWRLLPALSYGTGGIVVGVLLLCISTLLLPMGILARFMELRQTVADRLSWASGLAMGLFSSVLVLTLLRDVLLLIAGSPSLAASTAQLVVPLALTVTLIGFMNARRLARVVTVDIPLAGLPAALVGF